MREKILGQHCLETVKLIQGIFIELHPDGRIDTFASFLENPLGYTSDEICGKNWFDLFVSVETAESGPMALRDLISKSENRNCRTKIRSKTGETLFIDWRFQSVRNSSRDVPCICGVGQDVSRCVAAEQELHQGHFRLLEKNRVLTCLYKIAQMAVDDSHSFDTTLQAIIDLIPQAFERPKAMTAAIRLAERSYQTAEFESSHNRYGKDIVIKGVERGRVEVGCLKKDSAALGTKKVYSAEEEKLMASAARKVAFIIERHEENQRKLALEEQLRHADRLATIGQLAAGIAHELNNPLGDILGFAQLSANHPDLPELVYQDMVKIVKSTLYAREVIKKVLLFSRQTHPREDRANLNQLIEDWVDFIEFRCAQNDIEIVLEMDPSLPSVSGDPAQLNQVLINLVVNAIHAMPDGGTLTIKTAVETDGISMSVKDTGHGMGEDVKEKIFLPFFTTKEVDQGTGLGLSVVYGIINEHGGSVEVDSRVGTGSIFEVKLPC